jgi:hypothetical protein
MIIIRILIDWIYWNRILLCHAYGWKSINGVESTEPATAP